MKVLVEYAVGTVGVNFPIVIISIVIAAVLCICGIISDKINRDKGYRIGFAWGFFLGILGIITVALRPAAVQQITIVDNAQQHSQSATLEERLAETKNLLDKGIITNEEYAERRKKILENVN